MAAPTNTSFLTATDLGTLPADVTQTVDFSGTTYPVYYSFTATATGVIGAFGFGDLVTYRPTPTSYLGPATSPTPILGIGVANRAFQFPVVAGSQYFLEFTPNVGNPSPAVLTLNVQAAPNLSVPRGALAVNDAATGFPLAFLSATADYTVRRFQVDFPAGEAGDTSLNGFVLVENIDGDTFDLYRPTNTGFTLVSQTATGGHALSLRLCQGANVFYTGESTNPATFRTITTAGVVSGATSLTGSTTLGALAANNDQTILYHADLGTAAAIKRWDLVGGTALSTLAAGMANYAVSDLLVLSDDTIIAGYSKSSATKDYKVLIYQADGTVLQTVTIGQWETSEDRLAYALDDPDSFWVMHHPVGADDGKITFLNIQVSDGSTISTISNAGYTNGSYDPPSTATPLARFGPSSSCPFWIMRSAIADTQTFPIRRLRRFLLPSSDDNKNMQIPTLELLMRTGLGETAGTLVDPPIVGTTPQVMLRISKDGGKTWGPERWRSAGDVGKYANRVRWLRATGNYRNAVCEVTVSDVSDWQFLAMMGDPVEGSS